MSVFDVWRCAQRGLVYPSPEALFVAFSVADPATVSKPALGAVLTDARAEVHERLGGARTSVVLGVGFALWRALSAGDGSTLPAGMVEATGTPFAHPGTAFADTGIDLWFHVKSDDPEHCAALGRWLRARIEDEEGWADPARTRAQAAATKSQRPDRRGGKVLGSRFSENLNNPTDPLTIQHQAVVGPDDPSHLGASFVLAQRFTINWDMVLSMSPHQVEDLVGRSSEGDTIIPSADEHSHIKRARAQGDDGTTTAVLRLGLPFGHSAASERADLRALGASRGDEEGIYFAGYARSAFTLHSCLHLVGEPTAVGRLDQMLQPFLDADLAAGTIDADGAQEVIDCFWVKLGRKVLLNRRFVEDHQVFGNLAMGGVSAPYPQGSSINQWIQQVTVGGTVADDEPGAGTPAYGAVTLMCLRAARRLPLNAPCLSLRTRADMPDEVLHEAALAHLSGGAHPILLSDEKVIPGLVASGEDIGAGASVAERAGGRWDSTVALAHARDYACDGCYEPQLSGRSWFTLGGVVTTAPLEAALNQGKTWQSAGPTWFRGTRVSFTSRPAQEIETFDDLLDLYFEHLRWMYAKQVDGQIGVFGTMNDVCPAPLLSVLVEGCQEKGLDYYEGGPLYNAIAPCLTGLSTLIDSLWAIRALVFDRTTARTSLPELVDALRCDWGEHMVEPFVSVLEGPARIAARAERFRRIRAEAMALPRYGHGRPDIDAFGDAIIGRVARTAVDVFTQPVERTAQAMVALAERLGTEERPFGGFQIQPGVGTFENYLDWGNQSGASADGRLSGDPLASDLSPSPSFGDLPIDHRETPFAPMLAGFGGPGVEAMWDAAPVDVNIREDFPVDDLAAVLRQFASGKGSSVLTVTCADPETYAAAARDPERFDLLRVRMGGWTEFFVTMFPPHQAQHERRPFQTPGDAPPVGPSGRTATTSTRSGIYRAACADGREVALSEGETFPPCGTHGSVEWTLVQAVSSRAR